MTNTRGQEARVNASISGLSVEELINAYASLVSGLSSREGLCSRKHIRIDCV